jgi:CDP-diglyceride synthetase
MKNKIGKICGFVFGLLFSFLVIVLLSRFHPEEDLAGIVIITLLISGLFFAFVGSSIQRYFVRKKA